MSGTETLLREPAIQAVGWALLHFIWQGALAGVLAGVALRALRNSAADVRYVVAAIALALMATMPAVTGVQAWRTARAQAKQTVTIVPPGPAAMESVSSESPALAPVSSAEAGGCEGALPCASGVF